MLFSDDSLLTEIVDDLSFLTTLIETIRLRRKTNKLTTRTSCQCYLMLYERNRYVSKILAAQEGID